MIPMEQIDVLLELAFEIRREANAYLRSVKSEVNDDIFISLVEEKADTIKKWCAERRGQSGLGRA